MSRKYSDKCTTSTRTDYEGKTDSNGVAVAHGLPAYNAMPASRAHQLGAGKLLPAGIAALRQFNRGIITHRINTLGGPRFNEPPVEGGKTDEEAIWCYVPFI